MLSRHLAAKLTMTNLPVFAKCQLKASFCPYFLSTFMENNVTQAMDYAQAYGAETFPAPRHFPPCDIFRPKPFSAPRHIKCSICISECF